MKSINKILMKAKLKNYKKYKERDKRQVLDLNNQVTKYMANASFYRPKFKIINLMTNCWVGGQLLTLWKSLSSFLNKTKMLASELGPLENMKVVENWLSFPEKKIEVIWTSRTPDMGQTLNSVRVVEQIRTSLLLLWFGLENGLVRFLCSHESCRPMSHQVCVKIWDHLDI